MSALPEVELSLPKRLHLGCGKFPKPTSEGWVNLDQCRLPGVDVVANLDDCAKTPLPFDDDAFDEVFGSHVLEHIINTLPMMQELHRVCRANAVCVFRLPFGGSDDAWENPTHVRPYFLHSFLYFSQGAFFREDYGYRGDWQAETMALAVRKGVYSSMTKPDIILEDIMTKRNVVLEMVVTLRCIKPIRPAVKESQMAPRLEFALV